MKVLIAEDDLHIRNGLQEILQVEGYETVTAAEGRQALQVYQREHPDFVLLDIMMPGCNGYDVCREIRASNAEIPIIFISAKSEEIDRVVGLELGGDDFIMKPFGSKEVVARIRAVTRRCLMPRAADKRSAITSGLESMEEFLMGDLRVLPAELRAHRAGQQIELSLRDVRILATLHQRSGLVVPRDQLYSLCWGRDYLPSSRTLDQHMSKLRKAIEIDPSEPQIIRTIHGVGYRYDAGKVI